MFKFRVGILATRVWGIRLGSLHFESFCDAGVWCTEHGQVWSSEFSCYKSQKGLAVQVKTGTPCEAHEGASNSASERLLQVVYFFGLVFGTLGRRDIHNSINIVTTRKKR